jgi:hypothetical protein
MKLGSSCLFSGESILNSKVTWIYLQETAAVLGDAKDGGRVRMKRTYMQHLSIPTPTEAQREAIEELVGKLLAAHATPPAGSEPAGGSGSAAAQIAAWERALNALVYEVYGLTEAEVAIVEGELG